MAIIQMACPECGASAVGTVEIVDQTQERGIAYFVGYAPDRGEFVYVGKSTMTFEGADDYGSTTATDDAGRPIVACRDGHEWPWEPPTAAGGTAP